MVSPRISAAIAAFSLIVTGSLAPAPIGARPAPVAVADDEQPMTLDRVCPKKGAKKGAILGAIAGGLAGLAIGKDATGALVGAAAGGGLGYLIGRHWDKKACEKSRAARDLALQTGQSQRWAAEDGTKSFDYIMNNEHYGTTTVSREIPVLADRELQMGGMTDGAGVYTVSTAKLNLRDRPGSTSQSKVLDSYAKGEKLKVLGRSEGGDWLLVSKGGEGAEGWVSAKSLAVSSEDPAKFAKTGSSAVKIQTVAVKPLCMTGSEMFAIEGKSQAGETKERCRDASGKFA